MIAPDRLLRCQSCGITFLVASRRQSHRDIGAGPRVCPGCAALETLGSHRRGTIKWFDPRRGYGFIKPERGPQAFFHRSDLESVEQSPARRGQQVEMEIEDTDQGPRARHVTPLNEHS